MRVTVCIDLSHFHVTTTARPLAGVGGCPSAERTSTDTVGLACHHVPPELHEAENTHRASTPIRIAPFALSFAPHERCSGWKRFCARCLVADAQCFLMRIIVLSMTRGLLQWRADRTQWRKRLLQRNATNHCKAARTLNLRRFLIEAYNFIFCSSIARVASLASR